MNSFPEDPGESCACTLDVLTMTQALGLYITNDTVLPTTKTLIYCWFSTLLICKPDQLFFLLTLQWSPLWLLQSESQNACTLPSSHYFSDSSFMSPSTPVHPITAILTPLLFPEQGLLPAYGFILAAPFTPHTFPRKPQISTWFSPSLSSGLHSDVTLLMKPTPTIYIANPPSPQRGEKRENEREKRGKERRRGRLPIPTACLDSSSVLITT